MGWAGAIRAAGGVVGAGTTTAGGAGMDAMAIPRSATDSLSSSTSAVSYATVEGLAPCPVEVAGAVGGAVATAFSS